MAKDHLILFPPTYTTIPSLKTLPYFTSQARSISNLVMKWHCWGGKGGKAGKIGGVGREGEGREGRHKREGNEQKQKVDKSTVM